MHHLFSNVKMELKIFYSPWHVWGLIISISIMIAQRDSSLSGLPELRTMIAQWDSSLSVLAELRAMIAQWDSSLSGLPELRP